MSKTLLIVAAIAALVPVTVSAQRTPGRVAPASAVAEELVAEHHQWEADHQQWVRDHAAVASRLRTIAASIERGDPGLARHGSEIDVHGAELKRGVDSAMLERTHARLRSEHENTRLAHHDLLDAVKKLGIMARDDETSRTIEDDQREPGK